MTSATSSHRPTTLRVLLDSLSRLNQAPSGGAGKRWPHKPLLLLLVLARFQRLGTTEVLFSDIADDLARVISDYAPTPRAGRSDGRDRAAMLFVHLERSLWQPRWADGTYLPLTQPERANALLARGAQGRLHEQVETLLAEPLALAAAARTLLTRNFTPSLEAPLLSDVGLDLMEVGADVALTGQGRSKSGRNTKFAEKVYIAYDYACAVCGYDGGLGRSPVGLEAAHIIWHSQSGSDTLNNACALCSLHHILLDKGASDSPPSGPSPSYRTSSSPAAPPDGPFETYTRDPCAPRPRGTTPLVKRASPGTLRRYSKGTRTEDGCLLCRAGVGRTLSR